MNTPLSESPHPLIFLAETGSTGEASESGVRRHPDVAYRTEVMGLGGFQKEGMVEDLRTGRVWRLACDEGTYLRGENRAPAPLAYWIAGVHADITARIGDTARRSGVEFDEIGVSVGQGFGVQGSFAKGEALALVHDFTCDVDVVSDQDDATVESIVRQALAESAALEALTGAHDGLFALATNGRNTPISGFAQSTAEQVDPFLRHVRPPAPVEASPAAAPVGHPDGDKAPIMLRDDDDGTVRWRVAARGGQDAATGLITSDVSFSGNVPVWTLFSDPDNQAAPAPLAHLSIGTAFCFHTQLCRYVSVRRLPVEAPRLAQLSRANGPSFAPLDTRLFINGQVSGDDATSLMTAAARTCYAHQGIAVPVRHHVSISSKSNG